MMSECPACREPVSFLRSIRTTAWGRFSCKACGSILGVSVSRRMWALIPWIVAILFMLHIVRIQDEGLIVTIAGFSLTFFAIFYTIDKVVLIERRAFRCTKCGYDLQGLTEHRCPECGTNFDPQKKAEIEARIGRPRPRRKYQWIAIVVITLLTLGLIGNILFFRIAQRRQITAPPPPASLPVVPADSSVPSP